MKVTRGNRCISIEIRLKEPSELAIEREFSGGVYPYSARTDTCVFYPLILVYVNYDGALLRILNNSSLINEAHHPRQKLEVYFVDGVLVHIIFFPNPSDFSFKKCPHLFNV